MKQSGIDWIGEIPDGWEINKIDSLYTLRNEKVSDKDYPPLSVTMQGVVPQLATAAKSDDSDNRKLVKKGDFAINSRSDRRGSSGVSNYDGSVSLINTVLIPRGEMNPIYYNWLFHTIQFEDEFYKWGHGIVDDLWTTRWQDMKNIFIPLPPLAEQQKIASYLDKKISQIDAIITEAKQSIEEYKAWKQSVIFEAVTGKNKSGAKKDSGIEWIGEIPEGWSTIKFKYLHSGSNVGESIDKELCNDNENDTVFYTAGLNPIHTIYKQFPVWKYTKQNDLLLARNGTPYVYNPLTNAVYSDHIIRVTIKEDYSKKYVQYAIQQSIFNIVVDTVSITTWSASLWNNQFIPLPPRNIQEKIVEIIENKLNKINSLVLEKESLIADLTEYKKSLIFEVVTGKKQVSSCEFSKGNSGKRSV